MSQGHQDQDNDYQGKSHRHRSRSLLKKKVRGLVKVMGSVGNSWQSCGSPAGNFIQDVRHPDQK